MVIIIYGLYLFFIYLGLHVGDQCEYDEECSYLDPYSYCLEVITKDSIGHRLNIKANNYACFVSFHLTNETIQTG